MHGAEPVAREGIIVRETCELVPIVVDGVDLAVVGPQQFAAQQQIVGRVGEDEIDGFRRNLPQFADAVTDKDAILQWPDIRPCLITHPTPRSHATDSRIGTMNPAESGVNRFRLKWLTPGQKCCDGREAAPVQGRRPVLL